VRKKAKNERGTIMSFFNNKKPDPSSETNSRHQSKSTNITTRRRKKEQEQQQQQSIPPDNHFLSSVHVEKTSLILFDEVRFLKIRKPSQNSSSSRLKH
jgi:hypothetical protein